MATKDLQRPKKRKVPRPNLGMALYLDDVRTPLENPPNLTWVVARSYKEFTEKVVEFYKANKKLPALISFDHDLHEEHINYFLEHGRVTDYSVFKEKTGMHCAQWLIAVCEKNNLSLEGVRLAIHSANPGGAMNIQKLLNDFKSKQLGPEKADCFLMKWPHNQEH